MYLTYDKLENFGAREELLSFFKKNYPNGANLIDIISNKDLPNQDLYWLQSGYTFSSEMNEIVRRKLNITNSKYSSIYRSSDIDNSLYIIDSEKVKDSEYIFQSSKIMKCNNVEDSKQVSLSSCVCNSYFVDNSERVLGSNNVTNSNDVYYSNFVLDSKSIVNSHTVSNSSYVSAFAKNGSKNITDSYFIMNCSNLKNCLFCEGIKDKEYYLFNKPFPEKLYGLLVKQMKEVLGDYTMNLSSNWIKGTIPFNTPTINTDFRTRYNNLPKEFWDWVITLPNYDQKVLYNITLNLNK